MNEIDPLIRALFDRLPPPGSNWAMTERILWLEAMASIFDLIYSPGDEDRSVIRPEHWNELA